MVVKEKKNYVYNPQFFFCIAHLNLFIITGISCGSCKQTPFPARFLLLIK